VAGAEARLDAAGVSLCLTDWKVAGGGAWSGRRVMALVGGVHAGHLDVYVHPDGRAVQVAGLEVEPAHQRRGLASVMMDALYAAFPTAWINHGRRSQEGTLWWDRYRDAAPERNVHNRPPAQWARYFDPVAVAAERMHNAYLNQYAGVHGHREAVYRYGEPAAEEARRYAPLFHEPQVQGPDPGVEELYGGVRLVLPPGLHRLVHDSRREVGERARILLEHLGHGNLPHDSAWNTTEQAAFADLHDEQAFDPAPAEPVTHLTFHLLPLAGDEVPEHEVKPTWVRYVHSPGIEVQLAGMSWRLAQRPWMTHSAAFEPAVDAAIAPEYHRDAGPAYRARYDEIGELLPGQAAQRAASVSPFAGREAEIKALAQRLQQGVAQRAAGHTPAPPAGSRHEPQQADHPQHQQQRPPRLR
jgi:GNAT superfamily N-acetyltransferase